MIHSGGAVKVKAQQRLGDDTNRLRVRELFDQFFDSEARVFTPLADERSFVFFAATGRNKANKVFERLKPFNLGKEPRSFDSCMSH